MITVAKVRVLFVCLGNICRSPTAEGVFRKLVAEEGLAEHIEIDSAGTHAYHIDEPPDQRAQAAALRRGVDISGLRGRKATSVDIVRFDYVLAMDRENYENLMAICPEGHVHKVRLFMEFAPHRPAEVPDPYFGGTSGFDRVLDMIEEAASGLLEDIRRRQN
jgi:protein-tyrosine phosphatase